ncbi:unnamed protein product [Cyprideis torosa]|uniref:Uncharacterized protein n=2 Tax=Cyprideis torosa TaxID=163714 RepID=A0A7R8WMB0_9CRUS|nr:unnamed protein product [Cyprideis torosa]CAG0903486.1 unnamed protein product [Cyprideis torosa]
MASWTAGVSQSVLVEASPHDSTASASSSSVAVRINKHLAPGLARRLVVVMRESGKLPLTVLHHEAGQVTTEAKNSTFIGGSNEGTRYLLKGRSWQHVLRVILSPSTSSSATAFLLAAVSSEREPWFRLVRCRGGQGSEEVVRLLLDRGLDEMHRDNSGWAPLHYAAFEGHAEVSQMLITAGAKVNEVDTEGRHALILAAQEGHVGVVSVLIRNGARLSLRGHDGRNVLRVAALQGHRDVVQFLLCHQAKINYRDPDGRTTLYILALENKLAMAKFFLDHRAQVDLSDTEGRSPLHVASWQGHSQMCDLLMNYGANPNAVDNDNRTPLQSASWQGNADVVHLLLSRGASANHMCNQGATALCIAAQEGHLECVRVLLKYGANPNHLDACGRSPIRVAFKGGHHSVVQLLESVTSNKISTMDSPSGSSLISRGVSTSLGMEDASPGSTCDKRRSFISIGNNSSSGKSSSNISSTTHSRGSGGGGVVGQTPSYPAVVSSMGSGSMSFTQQLQQATRFRNRLPPPGGCPQSRFPLSPHDEDPESPVYATPPISPESDGGFVGGPGDVTTPMSSHHPLGGALRTAPSLPHQPPSHFAKNEHMRIILGCTGIHNGHQSSSSSSSDKSSSKRPCNGHAKGNSNGIFNGNGALEKPNPGRLPRESGGGGIGEGIRNFLKGGVAGRLKRPFLKSHSTTTSSSPNAVTDGGQTDVDQMLEILRKETPL